MKVSIVTPSYNMSSFLGDTIDSVLCNLAAGDEYFVMDGGSTDGSVEIIRRFEPELSGWTSEPDRGYADALAKGFSRSTGEVMCWINAGDLLLPGALHEARKALEETRADMIFGDDFYIDENDRVIFLSRGYVRELRSAMLYGSWTPLQDACFWRREVYRRVGGLDSTLTHAADYDLFLRMSLFGDALYVPKAFSAFRRHRGQKSIAGATAYRQERELVRTREVTKVTGTAARKALARMWHTFEIRWRTRVWQR